MANVMRKLTALLLALIIVLSMTSCALFQFSEDQFIVIPEDEVWVYDLMGLQDALVSKRGKPKIILKAGCVFNEVNEDLANRRINDPSSLSLAEKNFLERNTLKANYLTGRSIIAEEPTNVYKLELFQCTNMTIENLVFTDDKLSIQGGGNITVKNCQFSKGGFICNWLDMISAGEVAKFEYKVTNLTIERCSFKNITPESQMFRSAITVRTFDTLTIKNNYFDDLEEFNGVPIDAICLAYLVHSDEDQRLTAGTVTIEENTFGKNVSGRHIVCYAPDNEAYDNLEACYIKYNTFYKNFSDENPKPASFQIAEGQGSYINYQCDGLEIGPNQWEEIPEFVEMEWNINSLIYANRYSNYSKLEQFLI